MRLSELQRTTLKSMVYFFIDGDKSITHKKLMAKVNESRVYEVRQEVLSRSCFRLVDNNLLANGRSRSGRISWALTELGYNAIISIINNEVNGSEANNND